MHAIILICSASLVILTLVLAFWTSLQRGSSKVIAYGAPLEPTRVDVENDLLTLFFPSGNRMTFRRSSPD